MGPVGHLVGGALDVTQALAGYKLRVRRERIRNNARRAGDDPSRS
jgi:hypothetical protein